MDTDWDMAMNDRIWSALVYSQEIEEKLASIDINQSLIRI